MCIMRAECEARPTLPAFLLNPTKGAVRASSTGSAARYAAPFAAASAASCARPHRHPVPNLPQPSNRKHPRHPGGRAPRAGRPPLQPPSQPGQAGSRAGSAANASDGGRASPPPTTAIPHSGRRHIPAFPLTFATSSTRRSRIAIPYFLSVVLEMVARYVAENAPPELGMADPHSVFSILWGSLAGPLGQPAPDTAPAEQPDTAPTSAQDAVPETPPDTLPEAHAPGLPDNTGALATSSARDQAGSRRGDRFPAITAGSSAPVAPIAAAAYAAGRDFHRPCHARTHACAGPP